MSASERLERLLYLLPRAAQPHGVHIQEVARVLGVAPEIILADIEEATARVFYHPAGMVDALNISVEGDLIRLYGSEFERPVRLNAAEAMALGLGLRVLAAEADASRRLEILQLAQQLERELVTPALELQPLSQARLRSETPTLAMQFGADDFRGDIAQAIEDRVYCDVVYLKPDAAAPVRRRIAPLRLLFTRGQWYLRAADAESSELRSYRLDRLLEFRASTERHELEDRATAPAFDTQHGDKVEVRYSAQVARWVAEREHAQCEPDGTLVLTHDVVDMNWLARHVLQYGGEAVVQSAPVRPLIRQAARQVLQTNMLAENDSPETS